MSGVIVNGPGGESGIVDGKVWVQLDSKVRELPIACDIAAVSLPKSAQPSLYRSSCSMAQGHAACSGIVCDFL